MSKQQMPTLYTRQQKRLIEQKKQYERNRNLLSDFKRADVPRVFEWELVKLRKDGTVEWIADDYSGTFNKYRECFKLGKVFINGKGEFEMVQETYRKGERKYSHFTPHKVPVVKS